MNNCKSTLAGERTQNIKVNNVRTGRMGKWNGSIYLLLAHLKTHRIAVHGDRLLDPTKVSANGRPVALTIEVQEPNHLTPYRSAILIATQDGEELARYQ